MVWGGDENWADVARFLVAVRKCIFHHCIIVLCFDIDQTPAAHGFHLLKEPINTPEIILPSPSSYRRQFVSLTHTLNQFLFVPCIVLFVVQLLCESSPTPPTKHARTHIHTHTQNSVHEVISPQRHFYEDALYLHGSVQPIAFQSFLTLSQPLSFV